MSSREDKFVAAVLDFAAKEADEAHRQCDRCSLPREWNGAPLSMSQRVAFLAEAFLTQKEQLGSL